MKAKQKQKKVPKPGKKQRRMLALEAAKMMYDQTGGLARTCPTTGNPADSYEMFKLLLLPLETVKGDVFYHPEGDALYHSLQVFDLARREGYACDIEFLQAALLHDIGKALDPRHHAQVGAEVVTGLVSLRVVFLIEHHMDALKYREGVLGHKKSELLQKSEYFQDLMALRDYDDRGRKRGVRVETVDEALTYLKNMDCSCFE